jgi:hypothetical protein
MAIFSCANRTSVATITTAAYEMIAGANNAYSLKELGITINAATASVIGFGVPAAIGITPAGGSTVQAEDSGNTTAGNTTTATTWGTGPTVPTTFFRRVSTPATIGAGIIWTFPRGLNTLKAKSTVLWNITANSVMDVWVVVDE